MGFIRKLERKELLVNTYHDVRCDRCDQALEVQEGFTNSANLQYDNALILEYHGGYGMFVDRLDEHVDGFDEMYNSILCHKCGHELMEWLGKDPDDWHYCPRESADKA